MPGGGLTDVALAGKTVPEKCAMARRGLSDLLDKFLLFCAACEYILQVGRSRRNFLPWAL